MCAVDKGRIPEGEGARALRTAVDVDHLRLDTSQRSEVLCRIGNGRAGSDELRFSAVQSTNSPQPPQYTGDLRAKDAAIGVRLVDDHEAQITKEATPDRVVGQDAQMQHVRVGEDDLAALPQPAAAAVRGVAIVGAHCHRQR